MSDTPKMTDKEITVASKRWEIVENAKASIDLDESLQRYREFLQVVELRQKVDPAGKIHNDEPKG